MNIEDDFVPRGFIRFNLIACSDCDIKYITTEGTDNAYICYKCRKDLMGEEQMQYDVPEKELAEFLEKNYKGKNIGNRREK